MNLTRVSSSHSPRELSLRGNVISVSSFLTSLDGPILLVTTSDLPLLGIYPTTLPVATVALRKKEKNEVVGVGWQKSANTNCSWNPYQVKDFLTQSGPKDLYRKQHPMTSSPDVTIERNEFPLLRVTSLSGCN